MMEERYGKRRTDYKPKIHTVIADSGLVFSLHYVSHSLCQSQADARYAPGASGQLTDRGRIDAQLPATEDGAHDLLQLALVVELKAKRQSEALPKRSRDGLRLGCRRAKCERRHRNPQRRARPIQVDVEHAFFEDK